MKGLSTMTRRTKALFSFGVVMALATASFTMAAVPAEATDPDPATQQYRPYLHYTPEKNWMNDPNGLIYHNGTYHMYYQYNPNGTTWGNMSWGHATSTDLMHWAEQPLAIAQTLNGSEHSIEDIFSGSIVVDSQNTTGFGTLQNPPLVAVYTSNFTNDHPTYPGKQAQSLAYSTDDGQTWTKYGNNPVLNRNTTDFRDPKVFWYQGATESYWVMSAVEANEHRVLFYKSTDLKSWDYLDDFTPANATGGQWECPDLFPLAVDGDPNNIKWVLVVNINPGAVAGGSGGQYFVGDFDGIHFTSETTDPVDQLPPGNVHAGFNGGNYNGWNVQNDPANPTGPWGSVPVSSTVPGQTPVTGSIGAGLINSFHGGDAPVGTIESQPFTVDSDYINMLVGGGNHPHLWGGQLGNEPPPGYLLFDGFDYPGTLTDAGWQLTGDFQAALNPSTAGGDFAIGKRINTFEGGSNGDNNVGTITSPEFYLTNTNIGFLLGGGQQQTDGQLQVELLVDGAPVRTTTGKNAGDLNWQNWDVSQYYGQIARIRIVDNQTGPWGHLTLDNMVLGPEPAKPRSVETSVNLMVNGQTVRSSTGKNSENLDWTAWNVKEFKGSQATIKIIDNNRSDWGHILADEFVLSDTTKLRQHDWLDWGKDYYAAVSFNNTPNNKRIILGWMNNWDYGQETPTSTWRGTMALPREVVLTQTSEGPRLRQQVVTQADALENTAARYETTAAQDIVPGTTILPITGDVVRIDAEFSPGTADTFGLKVLSNASEATKIGYTTSKGQLFIDRNNSGNESFHPKFPSVDDVPVQLLSNGRLRLRVYVDRASVEVFAQDGLKTMTDQVFPTAGANSIAVFSEGGTARLESLKVTPMNAAMWAG